MTDQRRQNHWIVVVNISLASAFSLEPNSVSTETFNTDQLVPVFLPSRLFRGKEFLSCHQQKLFPVEMTVQQGQRIIIGGICSCGSKPHRSEDLSALLTKARSFIWSVNLSTSTSLAWEPVRWVTILVPTSRVFHSTMISNYSMNRFHDSLTSSGAITSSGKIDKLPWPSAIIIVFVNLYLVINLK